MIPQRSPLRPILFALALGAVGAGIGYPVNLALNPVLEGSSGIVRELQGFLWNLVPLLALAGIGLGIWLGRNREPRP